MTFLALALVCVGFAGWAASFIPWSIWLRRWREPAPDFYPCEPGCPLCLVQHRIELHYHDCAVCQVDGDCAEMASLWEEQERATDAVFPETVLTATNGVNVTTYIDPPQPWFHWPRRG